MRYITSRLSTTEQRPEEDFIDCLVGIYLKFLLGIGIGIGTRIDG
jgi:hypothetical protein